MRRLSPDSWSTGVSPKVGPTALELRKRAGMFVLDGDRLVLQELARHQQCPALLARQRLDMDRAEQVDPHHLGNAHGHQCGRICSAAPPGTPWCGGSRCRSPVGRLRPGR